jgi:hypothetical protein
VVTKSHDRPDAVLHTPGPHYTVRSLAAAPALKTLATRTLTRYSVQPMAGFTPSSVRTPHAVLHPEQRGDRGFEVAAARGSPAIVCLNSGGCTTSIRCRQVQRRVGGPYPKTTISSPCECCSRKRLHTFKLQQHCTPQQQKQSSTRQNHPVTNKHAHPPIQMDAHEKVKSIPNRAGARKML